MIYARDLAPLPTTKVPSEFTQPRMLQDLESIDSWLSNQFKETQNLENCMRNGGELNP